MTELKQFVVYKLVVGEMVYIGSTSDLKKRVGCHKLDCFNSNSNNYNVPLYKYIRDNHIDFNIIEVEVLEEIENLFLTNKENEINARKREQYHIDIQDEIVGGNLLNDIRAYITEEEYKLHKAQYYQQNKEKLSQKFDCACGGKYRYKHKAQHFKTKKHLDYISKLKK
jgi:hypothetical protein